MVEPFATSDEDHYEALLQRGGGNVRGKGSRAMVVRLSGSGLPVQHANMVDHRGEHRVFKIGGGVR